MTNVERSLRVLLTEGVLDGMYSPGSRLPAERALVDRLAAPRSAIRRALLELEREGIVVRHVGRGTFLTDTPLQIDGTPANTSPAEIMQVRLLVEPPVTALAARVATQSDLNHIRACLDGGGGSDGFETFESWDVKLHRAIASAAHNELLMSIFAVITTARALPVWGSLKRRTSSPERRCRYHAEHSRIVEALVDRDADSAGEYMRMHLQNVSGNLLGRA